MVIKNALTYFLLFLCTISLIGFFLLRNSSREIIYSSEKKLIHSSELIKLEFSKFIENLEYDITHISNSPFIHYYLERPSENNRILLAEEYLSLLKSKPYYSQIRYISTKQYGQEIVRVDRDSLGDGEILPISKLQNKSGREYYIETIKLPESSIYLSDIDLNKEYGKISKPYTPTLRIACPVYHNGSLEGIIVINTALTELFNSLERITDNTTKMVIVNEGGYYLYSENKEENFGFEFGKPSTFKEDFQLSPIELSRVQKSIFNLGDNLYLINKLDFKKENNNIYLLSFANKNSLLKSYYSWRNTSFLIIIILGLLSFIIAFFYMNRQAKALQDIASKIKSFPISLNPIELTTTRKDEIGDLINSFNQMSSIIFHNISLLKEANKTAENAIVEKEEFLENMSHEIRNPLQSILGLTQILESENLTDHQQKIITNLKFNSSNLQKLVNEVLEFKNLQRTNDNIDYSWIDIKQFANQIYESNKHLAINKNINFLLDLDSLLNGLSFKSDMTKLSQIIGNLISNAIKFTDDEGEVKLKIEKLKAFSDSHNTIRFSVIDNGVGIKDQMIEQIRKRYHTQKNQLAFSKGFGLGLSIIEMLLNKLNSKLNIDSREGKGSSFWFDLSCQLEKKNKPLTDNENLLTSTALKNLRLLIVEDDLQILNIYKHIFQKNYHNTTYISNLDNITNNKYISYDIIILDYYLDSQDLNEYFSKIESLTNNDPLIFIISGKEINKQELPKHLHNAIIILKPFDTKLLLDIVASRYLEYKFGIPELGSIKNDYDNNEKIYTKAIELLISEWTKIEPELKSAILNDDIDTIFSIRHKIITTVRRLKLSKFEKLLNAIEKNIKLKGHLATASNISLAMRYFIQNIKANQT